MAQVAAIGEELRIQGLALAGVITCPAETAEDNRSAWRSLGDETAVVILTPRAASFLSGELHWRTGVLTVVMPP